ncbi:MAG: hypothetical protein BGN88_00385 [Clostridiales bacterium 43-6]|nr:MAG: hypothetical protein BGN88_00385 [Clostridiales bacterium 43-6]
MKKVLAALLVLVIMSAFAGCGSQKSGNLTDSKHVGYSNEPAVTQKEDAPGEGSTGEIIKKIVKNGKLQLEAENVEKTYAQILDYAIKSNGYEFKHERTLNGDHIVVTAQIKIAPEKLDLIMNFAGNTATIINSSTTSDDVTSQYYDVQTRLQTKKNSLEKYYEFQKNAKTTEELLSIQNQIDAITTEIEAMEGQIKLWNAMVSESTLDITINEKNDPLKPKKNVNWNALSLSDMGTLTKNGFVSVVNVLVSLVQWLFIILFSVSPLLVIAGIVLLIIRYVSRRNRKKRADEEKEHNHPES